MHLEAHKDAVAFRRKRGNIDYERIGIKIMTDKGATFVIHGI